MTDVFIIPREGTLVRDPINKLPLPSGGAMVSLNKFWRRRIRCGDVSVIEQSTVVQAKTKKEKR